MVKSKKGEEKIVRVQSMFPNCQKYTPCCRKKKSEDEN